MTVIQQARVALHASSQVFPHQLILNQRTLATFHHQRPSPNYPRALLNSRYLRQRGVVLVPPERGFLLMLPAAMQMHRGESSLPGVRDSQSPYTYPPAWPRSADPHVCTCTFSILCPMSPTDPPVKVLLTDGRHVGRTCPMEQEPLIHWF